MKMGTEVGFKPLDSGAPNFFCEARYPLVIQQFAIEIGHL